MENDKIVCPKCGKINNGKNGFCSYCGANIQMLFNQITETDNTKNKEKKKRKLPLVIITIIILVIAAGAGAFGIKKLVKKTNPVNKVVDCMENREYKEAKQIFDDKIKEDTDDYKKLTSELKEYLEDNKNSFYEEKITYEQMKDVISAVKSFSISELDSDIYSVRDFMEKIHDSRTAYQTAETYMDKKDYENAILNFSKVIMDDTYYETAQSRKQEAVNLYRSGVLSESDKYASDGDYTSAIAVLKEAEKILENDSEIKIRKDTYATEQKNNIINNAIDTAKSHYNNSDYGAALDELKKVESYNNEMVTGLYESYYNEFLESVMAEAETSFKESGHSAAISKLNEYSNYFEGNSTYEDKIEYFAGLAPVNITELNYFSKFNDWDYSAYEKDYLGNSFENCIVGDKGWQEYYINSAYKSFTGILAYGEDGEIGYTGKVEIYADDELIYSSPNIGAKTDPVSFSVNIEGKKYILIKFINISYDWYGMDLILADAKLHKY